MRDGGPTIRQLTAAMAEADDDAISRFYNEYFDFMFLEARRASGRDEQFCLDIVQDAMLKVIRAIEPMETEAQLGQWTRRLVRNVAYDRLRAELRRKRRETRAAPSHTESGAEKTVNELESRLSWLAVELKAMDPAEAHLLKARFKWGWTLRKIGQELGLSTSAVDRRLRRVLVRLRQTYRDGESDS